MKEKILTLKVMLDSCNKIILYTNNLEFIDFISDEKTLDATMMQLIHLGETTKKMYENFGNISELPISKMISMRNFIAHDYLGSSVNITYNVAISEIPKIKNTLEKLINKI